MERSDEEDKIALERSRFKLPDVSTGEIRKKLEDAGRQLQSIKEELDRFGGLQAEAWSGPSRH